jgi:hypothetical protein
MLFSLANAAPQGEMAMISIRTFCRPLAAASVLFALTAIPAAAFACDEHEKTSADAGKDQKAKRRDKNFPLKTDEFKQMVEKRIAKTRERLTQVLTEHNVPEGIQAQVKKEFENGANTVRAAAARVGADGKVTKEEAKEVKELAKDLKRKAREKFQMGRKGEKKGNA